MNHRLALPAAALLLTIAGCGSLGTVTTPGTKQVPVTTAASTKPTPAPQTTTTAPLKSAPPKESEAHKYVSLISKDADRVQIDVQVVLVALGEAQKGAQGFDINTVAQQAQQAHDDLKDLKTAFAVDGNGGPGDGHLGDLSGQAYDAINNLKNSMGDLVAYTGDPNPATLAKFTTGYQNAVQEWNDSITEMWSMAGIAKPPTI